jgi:hypothetical protein
MPFTVDGSRAPLIVVRFVGTVDDDAFERYLAEYAAVFDAKQRYAVVLDAMEAGVPTARQRARQAAWMGEHDATLRRLCVGGAFAIRSGLVRGALTAILWLQPLPFPYAVVGSVPEAELWARARLLDPSVPLHR